MKNLPDNPHRGLKILYKCISCDAQGMQPILSIKKNSTNADGSDCYTIKLKCCCGYINGENRPIWWNMGFAGELVGFGF